MTDEFLRLGEQTQFANLEQETEARWRLVESAWENNLSRNLMLMEYETESSNLIGVNLKEVDGPEYIWGQDLAHEKTAGKKWDFQQPSINSIRRTTVTSARPALNGYQKGRCFYCYREISIISGRDDMADVDHFFPHILKQCNINKPIDGVANLVLACQECNRGKNGKFERLPSVDLLDRLFNRNEYLISSHHPLRETLIAQTGNSASKRQNYLQEAYNCSTVFVGATRKWQPKPQGTAIF